MFAFNENKIYGAKMKQKLDEKAKGLTPVRNGKVAGAIPAESISSSSRNSGVKSDSGSGCDGGLMHANSKAFGCGD